MGEVTNAVKSGSSVHPQVISTNTTVDGDSFDLAQDEGYSEAVAIIEVTDFTDGSYAWELQESDDDSDWTAVADADLFGTEPTLTAAGDERVGYKGNKRYVRLSVTSTGVTSGASVVGIILGAKPSTEPVA